MRKLFLSFLTIITLQMQAQIPKDYYTYGPISYSEVTASKMLLPATTSSFSYRVDPPGSIRIKDTVYCPRISDDYSITYRPQGFGIIFPPTYSPDKKYMVEILIHGMGELSAGKLENLRNVIQGFCYGCPKIQTERVNAIATPDFKQATVDYDMIGVVPTYANDLSVSDINAILDELEKYYSVDKTRYSLKGFSLGGGAVSRYMTSPYASRIALAVPCSPVNWIGDYNNAVVTNLPVIGATNRTDTRVSPTIVTGMINTLNSKGITPPATLFTFPEDGHGSINHMLALNSPYVPQNTYAYLRSIDKDNPRPYPTGTVINPPIPPVSPAPNLTASFNLLDGSTVNSSTINLDASTSAGVKSGYDAYVWGVTPITGSWGFIVQGGAYSSGPTKTITSLRNGSYRIELTVMDKSGNTAKKAVTLNVLIGTTTPPAPKVVLGYDGTTVTFTDGTTEKGLAVYSSGKWTITTATGGKYEL